MKKLILKNGELLSPKDGFYRVKKDILIEDGRIKKIDNNIVEDAEIIDCNGLIISPGFIDIHVHCNNTSRIGLDPDTVGIQRGATTVFDAGSTGGATFEEFNKSCENYKTKVFTLLNVSKDGLKTLHELDDLNKIDKQLILDMVNKYPNKIVGLKARASATVVGNNGITPIKMAAAIAQETKLPLMVHVGNYPPTLAEVINLLSDKDIVTHAFHGKKGNILNDRNEIIEEAVAGRNRGVCYDIGHGSASFNLEVYKKAIALGFKTDFISSDLHMQNYEGPVNSIVEVMSKIMQCGETLEDVIEKTTTKIADFFNLENLGHLKIGYFADIAAFDIIKSSKSVKDSMDNEIILDKEINLNFIVYSQGDNSEIFREIYKK